MPSPITKLLVPLTLACALSVSVMLFSERSHQRLNQANQLISSSMETQAVASQILALVSDAETAQRGFLLTERREYLEPYVAALPKIDPKLRRLKELNTDNSEQRDHVSQLAKLIGEKFSELEAALALYKDKGPKAAQELIETDVGRRTMNDIRKEVGSIQDGERAELIARSARWNEDVASSRFGLAVITTFNLALVVVIYLLARREIVQRERIRKTLEEEVRERTAELSELSINLQNVQEMEKSKLARDIHDELGSILVSARMDVSWVQNRLKTSDPAGAEKLGRAMGILDEGVEIKRRIIEDLRPTLLDNLGLGAAIAWHVDQACQRADVECQVAVPEEDIMLSSQMSIALFRVVQEALTNIVRYAKATTAWITLAPVAGGLALQIRDNGIGIPPEAQRNKLSHGIHGMRQRIAAFGGEFRIQGIPGAGTSIEVFLPLPESRDERDPA
jgi:signal transduction histidine kinase